METSTKNAKGILFDMTRCSVCGMCVAACREKQGFPEKDPEEIKELSATAYTTVHWEKVDGTEYGLRNMCRHCVEPSCASVCPVGALTKTELGPVVYDVDKCIGCRYCMVACPFNIPRYEWDSPAPAVRKCNMCFDRISEGGIPACAEACMFEATVFGDREDLLAEARKRIKEDPKSYYPHVYGAEEVGGTSVLFLAPAAVGDVLGFKEGLGNEPLPALTWRVLSKIPGIVMGGGAALLAIWWITRRRDEVALVEGGYYGHGRGDRGNPRENGNGSHN